MALNAELVGKEYEEVSISVTPDAALAFADAIGERNEAFRDSAAAGRAGLAAQAAPPTFPAVLQIMASQQLKNDPDLGLDYSKVVHGEQEFEWLRPVLVGEELTAVPRIAGIRSKGSLEFLVMESDVRDASGETVVRARSTLISRHGA